MRIDEYEFTGSGGREYNQDCVGSRQDLSGAVFAVADGLGGHLCGEKASAEAIRTIVGGWDTSRTDLSEQLNEKICEANTNILTLQENERCVMKTTAAVLAISGQQAVWANSGDSRVYYFHDGLLSCCTNDHSVAFKKYKAGEITRDQIGGDEDQSCLLRSLGGNDRYEPEIYPAIENIEPGDAFLLCSDGAWEYLRDEEILIDLLKAQSATNWAELLMLRIMERVDGRNDNLSLITIMIS